MAIEDFVGVDFSSLVIGVVRSICQVQKAFAEINKTESTTNRSYNSRRKVEFGADKSDESDADESDTDKYCADEYSESRDEEVGAGQWACPPPLPHPRGSHFSPVSQQSSGDPWNEN